MRSYSWRGWTLGLTLLICGAAAAQVAPFEREGKAAFEQPVDRLVLAGLQAQQLAPAARCSDAVFVRRVFLDVTGTLPTAQEAQAFVDDTQPEKYARLVDRLLESPAFADYWTMKWCDLLRVKAEFPINLWPNAVQAYSRWIHDAVRNNMPYDQFARTLLTASGSNFREAPANFYRGVQGRTPQALAGAVALTFMGTRIETWPEEKRNALSIFFSRLIFKKTTEWKEEIVCLDPAPAGPLDAVFPDGTKVQIAEDEDPRRVFADWLLRPENPWFAANIANRAWAWLLGRGIVHEPDDFREDNPPSNPELLRYLQAELVNSHYDLRHLFRLILNSDTYRQSSIPASTNPKATALFACYPVRRLEAEVLCDALNGILGSTDAYTSLIPEPYTYLPETTRAVALADGSISSTFLESFGRSARDTGLESERNNQVTDAQRLYLLNSSELRRNIKQSAPLRKLFQDMQKDSQGLVRAVYLTVLSRVPSQAEINNAEVHYYFQAANGREAMDDLVWALLNSKEFMFRH